MENVTITLRQGNIQSVSSYDFGLPLSPWKVMLEKPLGIVFEENAGGMSKGVRVLEVVEGGNAAACPVAIVPGDELVALTGIKLVGAKYEVLPLLSSPLYPSCPLQPTRGLTRKNMYDP